MACTLALGAEQGLAGRRRLGLAELALQAKQWLACRNREAAAAQAGAHGVAAVRDGGARARRASELALALAGGAVVRAPPPQWSSSPGNPRCGRSVWERKRGGGGKKIENEPVHYVKSGRRVILMKKSISHTAGGKQGRRAVRIELSHSCFLVVASHDSQRL